MHAHVGGGVLHGDLHSPLSKMLPVEAAVAGHAVRFIWRGIYRQIAAAKQPDRFWCSCCTHVLSMQSICEDAAMEMHATGQTGAPLRFQHVTHALSSTLVQGWG